MKLFLQGTVFFCSAGMFLFFGVVIIATSGCGNNAPQKAALKAVAAAPANPLPENDDRIPAMYMERNDFLSFGDTKFKDKLVLQLSLQKDSSHFLLAVNSAEKTGKQSDKAKAKFPKPFAGELAEKDSSFLFEEHHTKENDFQKLWNEVKKYSLVKYIIFEPAIDSNNHFCYKITGVEKLPLDLASHGFATASYYSHPSNHWWK